jgi:hypothetical protein
MWDAIAYKAMGSEMYTSALMQANLEHRHLFIFPADIVLTIPAREEKPIAGLPPWKKGGIVYGNSAAG